MRKIARHYEEDEQGAITANITARKLKDLYNMSVSAYQDAVRFAEK